MDTDSIIPGTVPLGGIGNDKVHQGIKPGMGGIKPNKGPIDGLLIEKEF